MYRHPPFVDHLQGGMCEASCGRVVLRTRRGKVLCLVDVSACKTEMKNASANKTRGLQLSFTCSDSLLHRELDGVVTALWITHTHTHTHTTVNAR